MVRRGTTPYARVDRPVNSGGSYSAPATPATTNASWCRQEPTGEGDLDQDDGEDPDDSSPASSFGLGTPGDEYCVTSTNVAAISGAAVTLNPSLWRLVERGEVCPFEECAFTVSSVLKRNPGAAGKVSAAGFGDEMLAGGCSGEALAGATGLGDASPADIGGAFNGGSVQHTSTGSGTGTGQDRRISRCRHFHTLCGCRHTRGALKGLLFQVRWRRRRQSVRSRRLPIESIPRTIHALHPPSSRWVTRVSCGLYGSVTG